MSEFGHVLVGLWMKTPDEAEVMIRAIDERLRNIGADDPDRSKLQDWRQQAMNMTHRAKSENWAGWQR